MVRTQIQLTEQQAEAVRKFAAERELSLSEVIRRSVESYLAQASQTANDHLRERARNLIGMFASGRSDISSNHDQYLEDAFGS